MAFQFSNLRIDRIIVHQVFQRDENRAIVPPKFSTELTVLDQFGISTFQERIVNALGNASHSIEMTISESDANSTFNICSQLLDASHNDFKNNSKSLPLKLAQAQTSRKIPGGILVIFDGQIGPNNKRFIGIIKAEIHSGFSIEEQNNRLLLKYLSELLLTPQQKLYKIAIFVEELRTTSIPKDPENYIVFVYDHNMTRSETQQAAQYFYESFLGCSFSPSNKKLTSDFYTFTKEHINSLEINEEEKLDLNTSLYTYLKTSQNTFIEVSEFANQYFNLNERDSYLEFMYSKGIPERAILKDISYIKYKLRRRNIKFTSNVRISAPSDQFNELVQIEQTNDNRTLVSIKGIISRDD